MGVMGVTTLGKLVCPRILSCGWYMPIILVRTVDILYIYNVCVYIVALGFIVHIYAISSHSLTLVQGGNLPLQHVLFFVVVQKLCRGRKLCITKMILQSHL